MMDARKKHERYGRIYEQLIPLLQKTKNPIAQMATVCAVLFHKFDTYFWCGFYILDEGELTVGPYQGSLACQVLEKGKGVCWAAILQGQSQVVPDVHAFPGHIACDSRSNSEIAIPLHSPDGGIYAVLDVDSTQPAAFDETDREWLEKIVLLIFLPSPLQPDQTIS